ncbi:hypothetical protein CONLIGDRAFT_686037 [Coniochaeta ligniaria NRRL 30616]|uniref:C2H2-type domain-containing protein n=1 Tax=Coniochaeta ligniaria NRRL 30616 TaxID=1408157 RepID=A0A1J7I8K1_9PEZI|nr:hypothetical protein CONLIGDRAFT_686037 [Coniochaeta ligniaria NRRL 30616]
MGKKKRGHPDVEELISRPWCYYCERDFEDLKLLISHQKAKHFKCDRCGKRLNTAGGLSVHMNQVHKENLEHVENALANRQGLDTEIFGMEGIPEDILQQHNQRIIQNYYTAQAERHAATGNPPPGASGVQGPTKKIKVETPDEIKKRLAEHRARVAAQKAGGTGSAGATPADGQSPGQSASPFPPPQAGYPYPPTGVAAVPGVPVPGYTPPQAYPPTYPPGAAPPPGAFNNLPARPPNNGVPASNLPQRPPYGAPFYPAPGAPPQGYPGASTVDELVANAGRQGDDIDQMIRMAEAGIKPPAKAAEEPAAAADKKGKKDKEKNTRMVYADTEVSPEEKMARLPRYAFVPPV